MSCEFNNTITRKQEESLIFPCEYLMPDNTTPVDITDLDIYSTIENTAKSESLDATVTKTSPLLGQFTLNYGRTSVVGSYSGDIVFMRGEAVVKTSTFKLTITTSPTSVRTP